jgi:hypothetical protein
LIRRRIDDNLRQVDPSFDFGHFPKRPIVKDDSRYKTIQAGCAYRARLWQEYIATYQKVLDDSSEAFSAFSAEFRERYLRGTPSD